MILSPFEILSPFDNERMAEIQLFFNLEKSLDFLTFGDYAFCEILDVDRFASERLSILHN